MALSVLRIEPKHAHVHHDSYSLALPHLPWTTINAATMANVPAMLQRVYVPMLTIVLADLLSEAIGRYKELI